MSPPDLCVTIQNNFHYIRNEKKVQYLPYPVKGFFAKFLRISPDWAMVKKRNRRKGENYDYDKRLHDCEK
jgi:hypothetical protein